MKYTIIEMSPTRIKVEFENNSWAYVPVLPSYSAEDIDHQVSNYDPDFIPNPQIVVNSNVSVGEERTSVRKQSFKINYTSTDNELIILLANYFSERGDNRLKELVDQKLEDYIESQELTADKILNNLSQN